MKKKLGKMLYLSVIILGTSLSVSAQIYVRIRPVVPIIIRTPQPSRVHVWIGEEWEPEGNRYRYSGGHWDAPPHDGDRWNHGYWRHHRNEGHEWVRGSWKGKGRR